MGTKSERRSPGRPHRRTFHGVRLDADLEGELREMKEAGYLLDFEEGSDGLIVSRSRVEGEDYPGMFSGFSPNERTDYSRELFSMILDRLGDLEHGALHPRNVLHVRGTPVFLDPVANAARLDAADAERLEGYAIWLWGPRVPADWEVRDWDRISLLRMVALLAAGPDAWRSAPTPEAAKELCRRWAEAFLAEGELHSSDDRAVLLNEALALLETLPDAPPSEPPPEEPPEVDDFAVISRLLDETFERQGDDKVLRPAEEERIVERFQSQGGPAGAADELLTVELLRRGGKRQRELRELAAPFLESGVYPGSAKRYVRRSACRNAERLLAAYGVPGDEAAREVKALLRERNFLEEGAARGAWSARVEEYLQQHCKGGYSPRDFQKMLAMLRDYDLPDQVAESHLRRYLRQRNLAPRRGFLWKG